VSEELTPALVARDFPGLPPGRYVTLVVYDTGAGMPPEIRSRMFDPFFTGHGLGLAATQGIVRGHQGRIRVTTEQGRGAMIKVVSPAVEQASRPDPVAEPARPLSPRSSGLVLVVDDEEDVRALVREALGLAGVAVIEAESGAAALDRYAERGAEIGLVILDMTMPVMDGAETFSALMRLDPDVRVLLSSGFTEIRSTERFSGPGLVGFFRKPYTARALIERVQAALVQG